MKINKTKFVSLLLAMALVCANVTTVAARGAYHEHKYYNYQQMEMNGMWYSEESESMVYINADPDNYSFIEFPQGYADATRTELGGWETFWIENQDDANMSWTLSNGEYYIDYTFGKQTIHIYRDDFWTRDDKVDTLYWSGTTCGGLTHSWMDNALDEDYEQTLAYKYGDTWGW